MRAQAAEAINIMILAENTHSDQEDVASITFGRHMVLVWGGVSN